MNVLLDLDGTWERYSKVGIFECSVYDGIPDVLRSLQARAHRLFLATSKPRVFAFRILEHFGLLPLFSGVYGSELDGTNADKRHLVAHILKRERLESVRAVLVGDRAQALSSDESFTGVVP